MPTILYPDSSLNIVKADGSKTCHIEPDNIKLSVDYVGCNTLIDASNVTIAYGDGSYTQVNNGYFETSDDGGDKIRMNYTSLGFYKSNVGVNDIILDASNNLQMGTIKPSQIADKTGSYGIHQTLNSNYEGNLIWTDVVAPNLSEVLAQGADASTQSITGLASLTCFNGTVTSVLNDTSLTFNNATNSLVIKADASGDLSLNSVERSPFDAQLQKYLPITVNGTKYWIPMFIDYP